MPKRCKQHTNGGIISDFWIIDLDQCGVCVFLFGCTTHTTHAQKHGLLGQAAPGAPGEVPIGMHPLVAVTSVCACAGIVGACVRLIVCMHR